MFSAIAEKYTTLHFCCSQIVSTLLAARGRAGIVLLKSDIAYPKLTDDPIPAVSSHAARVNITDSERGIQEEEVRFFITAPGI
jgi:hypothetical protein